MDRLEFFEKHELLRFLQVHKNELALLEKPRIFLNQLRDHHMIPEDRYEKIIRMRKKENVQKNLYELLKWVEAERKEHIALFWKCAFNQAIMSQYPQLQLLYKSLTDGSFHFDIQLPAKSENEKTDQDKSQEAAEGEERGGEGEVKSAKKKRKRRDLSAEDGEQPGPSCPQTPVQRRSRRKISYSSPLKKGERNDIWEWPLYKTQIPVTCGGQEGMLVRNKLAQGEKCIRVNGKGWFSPPEFERLAGKHGYKNWKMSIRCRDTPLRELIEEGHLESKSYRRRQQANETSATSDDLSTDRSTNGNESEQDDERESSLASTASTDEGAEESDPQPQVSSNDGTTEEVFKVTCGRLEGNLHMRRFATGTCGKSIRTKGSWLTPMEFLEEALGPTDASWERDIEWDGKPLGVQVEKRIHPLLCDCRLCKPSSEDLEDQKNDDECCICVSAGERLVQCDECPRSFHQRCHLPHVDDAQCDESSQWLCSFCVYRINCGLYFHNARSRDAATSSAMSQHEMECYYLLMRLRCEDKLQLFASNPCLSLSDYSTVINNPMWLGRVAERFQVCRYTTVGQFVSDVQLIFANSALYNRENVQMLKETKRLQEFFDEDFNKVFNISS